jgi:chromosome segregation protein
MLELQHLDTQLARHQFDVFQTEIREREDAVEKLRVEIEGCSASVLRGEHEIARLREHFAELEQTINHSQQQALELKNQIDRHENRIQFNAERLRELETQNPGGRQRTLRKRKNDDPRHNRNCSTSPGGCRLPLTLSNCTSRACRAVDEMEQVENDLRAQQETLRKVQADAFAAAQQLTRVRNEITALELQKQGNVVRLEKLSAEKIQLEEERARLETRLQEFAANAEAEQRNVQSHRGTVEERQQRLGQIRQELDQATQDLDGLLRQQAEKHSRLNVLEQLQETHEGFSAGALAALGQAQEVFGSLADKIRVPDQYVTAIETALGHHLQLVLTEQPEAARKILADLSATKRPGEHCFSKITGRNGVSSLRTRRGDDDTVLAELRQFRSSKRILRFDRYCRVYWAGP